MSDVSEPSAAEIAGAAGDPVTEQPPRGDSVGRSLAYLSAANALQQLSAFVVGIALRSILGPAATGVWNLVDAWRHQLASVSLGAAQAADRDMPVLRSRGEHEREGEVRSVAFTFTLGEVSMVALAFLVYWAFRRDSFEPEVALGLALVPIMSLATSYVSLYQLFLKNLKEFRLYSILFVAQAVVDWTAVPLAAFVGLEAMLIGLAAGWVLRAFIHWLAVRRGGHFRIRPAVRLAVLLPMVRFGVVLSLVSLLRQLLLRLDSLVIGMTIGTTALGYYYLGPQVAAAAAALPLSLAVIAWPNLMETYGRDGRAGLRPHVERYLRPVSLVVSPIASAVGVFGVGVLVVGFLPDFRPGLEAMQIYVLTVMLLHPITLMHQVLVAVRRVWLLVVLTVAGVVVQAAILLVGSIGDLALTTAAWSAVAGQATIALGLLIACCSLLEIGPVEALRFWARLPVGWVALGALMLGLGAAAPEADGLVAAVAVAAGQLCGFVALGLVVLLVLDRAALRASLALLRRAG